jgi:hypothetical protein
MKKRFVIAGLAAGAVIVGRRLARGIGSFDMARCIEAMPDSAPPKWMFANITAIREKTDRILEILEAGLDEQSVANRRDRSTAA